MNNNEKILDEILLLINLLVSIKKTIKALNFDNDLTFLIELTNIRKKAKSKILKNINQLNY